MRAFVLAAGLGTRLRPYSNLCPKPLFPILGKPLLGLILERLFQEGFNPIALNLHHLPSKIFSFLEEFKLKFPRLRIETFYEPEILGPLGALGGAREFFTEATLVVNADILTNIPFRLLYEAHKRLGGVATMLLMRTNTPHDKVMVEGEALKGFVQGTQAFTYCGLQVVTPELVALLSSLDRELVPTYQRLLAQGKKITVQIVSGFYWRDIGTLRSYLQAHEDLLKGRAVVSGLTPKGPFVYPASLPEEVVFEDWVFLPEEVFLAPGTTLRRVVAWPGARVPSGFHEDRLFVPTLESV